MSKETYIGIVELDNDIIYLTRDNDTIYTNGVCNPGMYHLDSFEIDEFLTLDENIQRVVEDLESDLLIGGNNE